MHDKYKAFFLSQTILAASLSSCVRPQGTPKESAAAVKAVVCPTPRK